MAGSPFRSKQRYSGRLRAIASRVPGAMPAARWLHRLADPELRAIEWSQRVNGEALFQPFPETWEERYPLLFDAITERLAPLTTPRVLSFGCSTGTETRALRRRMPAARIVGIDANARAIAEARKSGSDDIEYRVANRLEPGERYDAILALAVFRHGEIEAGRPASSAAILPFARFARGVAMLDAALAPGGWLAICNSHFRFTDATVATNYQIDPLRLADNPRAPVYGCDDRRIESRDALPVLFKKLC